MEDVLVVYEPSCVSIMYILMCLYFYLSILCSQGDVAIKLGQLKLITALKEAVSFHNTYI